LGFWNGVFEGQDDLSGGVVVIEKKERGSEKRSGGKGRKEDVYARFGDNERLIS
jgi:hypothetical protein